MSVLFSPRYSCLLSGNLVPLHTFVLDRIILMMFEDLSGYIDSSRWLGLDLVTKVQRHPSRRRSAKGRSNQSVIFVGSMRGSLMYTACFNDDRIFYENLIDSDRYSWYTFRTILAQFSVFRQTGASKPKVPLMVLDSIKCVMKTNQ